MVCLFSQSLASFTAIELWILRNSPGKSVAVSIISCWNSEKWRKEKRIRRVHYSAFISCFTKPWDRPVVAAKFGKRIWLALPLKGTPIFNVADTLRKLSRDLYNIPNPWLLASLHRDSWEYVLHPTSGTVLQVVKTSFLLAGRLLVKLS